MVKCFLWKTVSPHRPGSLSFANTCHITCTAAVSVATAPSMREDVTVSCYCILMCCLGYVLVICAPIGAGVLCRLSEGFMKAVSILQKNNLRKLHSAHVSTSPQCHATTTTLYLRDPFTYRSKMPLRARASAVFPLPSSAPRTATLAWPGRGVRVGRSSRLPCSTEASPAAFRLLNPPPSLPVDPTKKYKTSSDLTLEHKEESLVCPREGLAQHNGQTAHNSQQPRSVTSHQTFHFMSLNW